jgi:hypothetical protein
MRDKSNFSGDRKYKVPPMDPLDLKEVKIIDNEQRSEGISFTLKNAKIYGMKDTKVEKAE